MSTVIKLKKSSVNGASPDPLNLEYGELALNYTDGKLYFRTSTNELGYFSTIGGQQGSLDSLSDTVITSPNTGEVLKYDGTNWINAVESGVGSSLPDQTNNSGKLLTTNGTNASWITPALVSGIAAYTTDLITATEGQTVFNTTYTVGYIDVYLNGIRLLDTIDYIATNGTSITLNTAAVVDDIIEVVKWENTPNLAVYTRYSYTATTGQTTFAAEYSIGIVDVYFNGIKLNLNTDYTANSGTDIVLLNAASQNDIVEIIAWENLTATSGVNLLPSQTGNTGYILTTNGTTASWIPGTTPWAETITNITASAGDKLFVDCSAGAVTVTLPQSPIMGDEVRVIDATGSAATNNITISRNGNNISGVAEDLVIQTNRAAFGLVFYNSTQGWVLMEK